MEASEKVYKLAANHTKIQSALDAIEDTFKTYQYEYWVLFLVHDCLLGTTRF